MRATPRCGRYDPDGTVVVGAWSRAARHPLGIRMGRGGHNVNTLVFETGLRRIDRYAAVSSVAAIAGSSACERPSARRSGCGRSGG